MSAVLPLLALGCGQDQSLGASGVQEAFVERWRYEGQFNWSNEHAQGDECGNMASNGAGSGEFLLYVDEDGASTVRIVGMGCYVTVEHVRDGVYQVAGGLCEWGEWPGLRYMQVTNVTFETLELDLTLATLRYHAVIERSLPDGNVVERCERADLTLLRDID